MAVKIQLRRGTASQWAAANPVLAVGELAVETDTMFYKIGDGVTAWNDLDYGSLQLQNTFTVLNGANQVTPATPQAETINLYAKTLAGRMMLRQQGPSGLSTPLQPSFFQNNIVMINTSATTALGTIGNTSTNVGVISHPVANEVYGYMANMISAATALATAGTGNQGALWARGSVPGANGFFINTRCAFPDSSYDSTTAGTGSRIFAGVTNQAMSASVASDNPAGHFAGFFRRHVAGAAQDVNWQFATKDNIAIDLVDTGIPFDPQKVYDLYIYCQPQGSVINWRIDNVTDNTSAEGSASTRLPDASIFMRAGIQVQTVDAVARNVRIQRIYGESDR